MKNKKESPLLNQVRILLTQLGGRCFRNNIGRFKTARGDYIQTGLCVGSSDLIGFYPITISKHMVGKKIAVFTAIETKSCCGKLSDAQRFFIESIKRHGGIGLVANSADDVSEALEIFLHGITSKVS